jgi:hypothetical protein
LPVLRILLQERLCKRLTQSGWEFGSLFGQYNIAGNESQNAGIGNTSPLLTKHFRLARKSLVNRAARGLLTEVLRRLCSVVSNRRVRPCRRAAEERNNLTPFQLTKLHPLSLAGTTA